MWTPARNVPGERLAAGLVRFRAMRALFFPEMDGGVCIDAALSHRPVVHWRTDLLPGVSILPLDDRMGRRPAGSKPLLPAAIDAVSRKLSEIRFECRCFDLHTL